MKLLLPIKPLTISRAFQGRRFKTKEYRDWEQSVLWLLKGQSGIQGRVKLSVKLYLKYAPTTDCDNCLKTLEDALTKSGVIEDDRKVWKLEVEKFQSDMDYIEITITPHEQSGDNSKSIGSHTA